MSQFETSLPTTETCGPARGRPRQFDPETALLAALRVFWTRGYDGASLSDLTEAMGITRPSLYACFGNKEALFRKALDLYERDKLAFVVQALEAPPRAASSRPCSVTRSKCWPAAIRSCLLWRDEHGRFHHV
jgi:AcrR family transcriptional regulator